MSKKTIFQGYDVRGIYPEEINKEIAYKIAQGYADFLKPKTVVIGHDVRLHSEELKLAMIEGLIDAGIEVTDIGCIATEMLYYSSGTYGFDGGIQVTASHLPREWHGAKFVRANAEPISRDNGLLDIEKFVKSNQKTTNAQKGSVQKKDILTEYCKYLLGWVDPNFKPFKITANANFGIAGVVLDKLIEVGNLPLEIVKLNYEIDGSFPKGRPDPYIVDNRKEFYDMVKESNSDFGVAWDSDADRVFFCADGGTFLEPYYTNTILMKYMLEKNPGGKIIYDPRTTWALIDTAKESGGIPILERVGHAFIKARMRKEDAIFSGESSGHTYYRDFWYADSGFIPFIQILEILSKSGKKLSEMIKPALDKYIISGEINFKPSNPDEVIKKIEEKYSGGEINKIDGISIEYPDWRINLRISNTGEPLLRLNMETKSQEILDGKLKEVISIIDSPRA